jgi:cell division inhibitor SulA/protein ImuA
MTSAGLDELLRNPSLWRASSAGNTPGTLPTGFRRLDERLPGGGWPLDTLIELLLPAHGVGEINLLVPVLRALGQQGTGPRRWIAWLGPPHLPYAPALAGAGLDPATMLVVQPRAPRGGAQGGDSPLRGQSPLHPSSRAPDPTLWAMEQALRSRACAAALGWVDAADGHALRRLKLAAEEGGSLGFLFRPSHRADEPSPAALRLSLEPRGRMLDVQVLKCQGGRPGRVEAVLGERMADGG